MKRKTAPHRRRIARDPNRLPRPAQAKARFRVAAHTGEEPVDSPSAFGKAFHFFTQGEE
jgi:hypothetical protein